jgi:hypothetical protein
MKFLVLGAALLLLFAGLVVVVWRVVRVALGAGGDAKAEALPVSEGALCVRHGVAARGGCARCGAFMCPVCDAGGMCLPCHERLATPVDRKALRRTGGVLVAGALVGLGFAVQALVRHLGEGFGTGRPGLERELSWDAVWLGLGALMVWGGVCTWQGRRWFVAVAGALGGVVFCQDEAWLFTASAGVWALVVLSRPGVPGAFGVAGARRAREDLSPGQG